jgi:hypothetical protein
MTDFTQGLYDLIGKAKDNFAGSPRSMNSGLGAFFGVPTPVGEIASRVMGGNTLNMSPSINGRINQGFGGPGLGQFGQTQAKPDLANRFADSVMQRGMPQGGGQMVQFDKVEEPQAITMPQRPPEAPQQGNFGGSPESNPALRPMGSGGGMGGPQGPMQGPPQQQGFMKNLWDDVVARGGQQGSGIIPKFVNLIKRSNGF